MAVWSDMNGFPEGGFPVLANANDMITLGNLYLEPLRANNYVIDVLGNNRLAGALVIAGALTGCAGIAAGGAISGATTIAANNTVTLSSATAPLTMSGASAVLNMSGENANILMSGLNSSIGTILQKVKKIFAKTLFLDERPKVGEDEVALVGDLASKAPLVHNHDTVYLALGGGTMTGNISTNAVNIEGVATSYGNQETIFINSADADPFSITMPDPTMMFGVRIFIYVLAIDTGDVTLDFSTKLNGTSDVVLTSADIGKSMTVISNGTYWYNVKNNVL